MKNILFRVLAIAVIANIVACGDRVNSELFIETEAFSEKGGWVVDQQFMDLMGSPFLMAHGMGIPVADAETTVTFPEIGEYKMFVRTRNWAGFWTEKTPGLFNILLDGELIAEKLGSNSKEWEWVDAGTVNIDKKSYKLSLHDLTGFNGRCDAIYFTTESGTTPPEEKVALRNFRDRLLNIEVKSAGNFDYVVVGGGVAGTSAALSAARLGLKVALIQNRPVLGGNNSSEVRVHLGGRTNIGEYKELGNIVNEMSPLKGGNAEPKRVYEDDKKMQLVKAEENITLFLNYNADAVDMVGSSIGSIRASNIETGEILEFTAPLFADCTGDGTIGALAGAEFMMGRESSSEYGESLAPATADKMTMGSSVQWLAHNSDSDRSFPDIDWGIVMDNEKVAARLKGDWNWETGMNLDQINDFERVRDYGLMVVYSNWSYLKNHSDKRVKFKKSELEWVAFIAGKRESRRLIGDYILREDDLTKYKVYKDGSAATTWSIDLHYPDPENSKHYRGNEFRSIAKHKVIFPYPIPYRCLYSKNVDNLFMAGRNISVTHVALGTIRVMRTTGMLGEVIGMAASICKDSGTTPRGVYTDHLDKLIEQMKLGAGNSDKELRTNYNLGGTLKTPPTE